jgi:Tetracyclin repressor-like, C-terminal domain
MLKCQIRKPRSQLGRLAKVRHLIGEFNGLFGKVMAELIAEGQSDPTVLHELYNSHISLRRASTIADIERGKSAGEFPDDTDPELLVDAIFGPMYYRLMLRLTPLTQRYGDNLIDQVLRGCARTLCESETVGSAFALTGLA